MNYFYFVGIDVAKLSFDATILNFEEKEIAYSQFDNNDKGIKKMLKWVKSFKIKLTETLFCAENMGIYVSEIACLSVEKKFNLTLSCPLMIKKSIGITRGKNDKIDSYRIASFALHHFRKLKLYTPCSDAVLQLKGWLIVRENLVKQKVSNTLIVNTFKSDKSFDADEQIKLLNKNLITIKSNIAKIEQKMEAVIGSDESINKNFKLLTSITGVGLIVASVIISTTGNFTNFTDHRKYACYCGVAPFEYSSGTSIRGKTKVSKTASMRIKTYITRSAISARRFDEQTKKYFKRKMDEGKHIASVTNAIKCKIIARCFAVIRRGTPYVDLQI